MNDFFYVIYKMSLAASSLLAFSLSLFQGDIAGYIGACMLNGDLGGSYCLLIFRAGAIFLLPFRLIQNAISLLNNPNY